MSGFHNLRRAFVKVHASSLESAVMFSITGALHEKCAGSAEGESPKVHVELDGDECFMSVESILLAGVSVSKVLLRELRSGSARYVLVDTGVEQLDASGPVQVVLEWKGKNEDAVDEAQRAGLIVSLLQGSANLA